LKLRVCHLITDVELGGGAERALANLLAGLDPARFESDIVTLVEPGELSQPLVAPGIAVSSLGMSRGRPTFAGLGKLVRHLRRTKPDILQTWLYHADLAGTVAAALARPRRLIWNVRCSDMTQTPGDRSTRWVLRALARLSGRPDAVVVNSPQGRLFHEHVGYHPKAWVDIPNGVDIRRFRPRPAERAQLRARFGIDPQVKVVGRVARFHPMKDCETLLRAAQEFSRLRGDVRFVLCGFGLDRGNKELMRLISELGIEQRVTLIGGRSDIEDIYPMFDVFAFTSAYGEGFPNVLIEAMACGVPCAATDVGAAREIVADTGAVVPARDYRALARGFETLFAADPAGLGARARERTVAEYSVEGMCARYAALYERVAG